MIYDNDPLSRVLNYICCVRRQCESDRNDVMNEYFNSPSVLHERLGLLDDKIAWLNQAYDWFTDHPQATAVTEIDEHIRVLQDPQRRASAGLAKLATAYSKHAYLCHTKTQLQRARTTSRRLISAMIELLLIVYPHWSPTTTIEPGPGGSYLILIPPDIARAFEINTNRSAIEFAFLLGFTNDKEMCLSMCAGFIHLYDLTVEYMLSTFADIGLLMLKRS